MSKTFHTKLPYQNKDWHKTNFKAAKMYVFFLFLVFSSVMANCPTDKCVKCTEKIYVCTGDVILEKQDVLATETLLVMNVHPRIYLWNYCALNIRIIKAGPLKIVCTGMFIAYNRFVRILIIFIHMSNFQ